MRKFLSFFATILVVQFAFAQLPAGSYGADFNLYPVNTTTLTLDTVNPVHLYEYLDAGKPTILDVSAVWCGPCWSYHSSGVLESAYNQYGPNGTNQLRVVFLEGDEGTIANLNGSGGNTQGNWLTGTPYPVIPTAVSPNTQTVVSDYSIAYFPTVYLVCPDRKVTEIGQLSTAAAILNATNSCAVYNTALANNAAVFSLSSPSSIYFCEADITPSIMIQRVGTAPVTEVVFDIDLDGTASTYTWTGNITDNYGTATVNLPALTGIANGQHTYTVTINTVNGSADGDNVNNSVAKSFVVSTVGSGNNVSQDFSSSVFPPVGWGLSNDLWVRYANNQAIYFDCYSLSNGITDDILLPLMDFSGYNQPVLTFDVAYAQYQTSNDKLEVMVAPCGSNTWTTVYNKSGATLSTAPATTSQFVPTSSQWRNEIVDLSDYIGQTSLRIKFKSTSNYGNVMWLDNINVLDGNAINENETNSGISIFPNPVADNLYINSGNDIQNVKIYNLQGQMISEQNGNVNEVSVSGLANGMYILQVTTANGVNNFKFTKE